MSVNVGMFLRNLREERHLTLRQVEERVGISNGYLSQMERGEKPITSIKVLTKLAEAYSVSVDDLMKVSMQESDEIVESLRLDTNSMARAIDNLPEEDRLRVVEFVEFLQYRNRKQLEGS